MHRLALLLGAAAALVPGAAVRAQTPIDVTEELEFDTPEAWGMKFFASLMLPTGLGVPQPLGAGGVVVGFEGGLVPQLSEEERRIGFGGSKLEDLNRTRVLGRLRAAVGLSERTSLELAWVPPVEVDGVKPHVLALAVGRPFVVSPRWRVGLRAYGQIGSVEGDITCSADEVAAGIDSPSNPFGCLEPSADSADQRLVGAELSLGYQSGRWRPWIAAALTWMDLEFQVGARYDVFLDRTLQLTDGTAFAVSTGLEVELAERWSLAGELFYSPLSVRRPTRASSGTDALLNGRLLVRYRIR